MAFDLKTWRRERRRAFLAAGLCQCGKARDGEYASCERCRAYRRKSGAKWAEAHPGAVNAKQRRHYAKLRASTDGRDKLRARRNPYITQPHAVEAWADHVSSFIERIELEGPLDSF